MSHPWIETENLRLLKWKCVFMLKSVCNSTKGQRTQKAKGLSHIVNFDFSKFNVLNPVNSKITKLLHMYITTIRSILHKYDPCFYKLQCTCFCYYQSLYRVRFVACVSFFILELNIKPCLKFVPSYLQTLTVFQSFPPSV